jgi:hypothetical protein
MILVVLTLAAGWVGAAEEQPLSNADIIKLSKLSLGDEVIIAKIKTAKAVKFAIATDDLIKLKESGVSSPVIAAMLDRLSAGAPAPATPAAGPAVARVKLVAKEGTLELKPMAGDLKTLVAPFVGMRRYVEFSGIASAARIKDPSPTLLLQADRDPQKKWWLVRLNPWDNKLRVIDLQSFGMWGGTVSNAPVPDESCNVSYTAVEEKAGLWRIAPKGALKPGEYGLFWWTGEASGTQTHLSDFGVDP